MSNESENKRIDLTQFEGFSTREGSPSYQAAYYTAEKMLPNLIAELKRCYEVMNEVILRAMDARSEEASDIIKHGDIEYIHVDEITYPFSESDIGAAFDSKASQ